ncbi:DEAD/DEAH box helicase family protein [Helicobacter himalayensis]|uniref:DEAD/DEAH box helicase family protein n=1 Tax=Helicobacter himalayensis TaxID=1591088 RepID=UPI003D6ED281
MHARALTHSALSYYEYLGAHNLGLDSVRIVRYEFKDEILSLQLGKRLFSQDGLMLELAPKEVFELSASADLEYNEDASLLKIAPNFELLSALQKHLKQKGASLSLYSDLKFLVKNVANYYEKNKDSLQLPTKVPLKYDEQIPNYLNKEQKRAVEMIFKHPLSYVWGPPGSGKTQVVLFEALYFYAKKGVKTCVLAPTNSALEQIFTTLLEHFKKMDFELHNLLRLGLPTQRFLSLYPECCDSNAIKKAQTSLFSQPISLKTRLKNTLIIGLTLDGFIKRAENLEIEFAHYFLDECAFAPLAKACALCVGNVPITLFGDHKQLMPICEMPTNELRVRPEVNLWNLSALFMEEFFNAKDLQEGTKRECESSAQIPLQENSTQNNAESENFTKSSAPFSHFETLSLKQSTQNPQLSHIASLNFTHRYGDNLARLLDSYIYHNGLRGQERVMGIYCIDSGHKSEADSNFSANEVRATQILYQHLLRRTKNPKSTQTPLQDTFAVITPFVKQRKELQRHLGGLEVLTIHGSQGREWDNVIFSPVSLHYYLTDSKQTNALYGLNVAISRIKKNLFIVCDLHFWQSQPNQFLHKLLSQATLIRF